jgi:hypothetical protein
MCVLQYIYPRDEGGLSLRTLFPALEGAVPGAQVTEVDHGRRGTLDWSSIVVVVPAFRATGSLFVVARNNAANVRDIEKRYTGSELKAVRDAPHYIWAQLKLPLSLNLAKSLTAIDHHNSLIATFTRHCEGVVDLPENEKLYSAAGFARYADKLRKSISSIEGRRASKK